MISVQCIKPVRLSGFDAATRSVIKRAPAIVSHVFRSEKSPLPKEVAISLGGRAFMRKLHRDFMNDPADTDVLSFPADDGGDIAICAPVAAQNARRFGEPVARELLRLIVHGALHLLGYKDSPARAQKKMWKVQERLVEELWTH
jgi:rRNA maturation RNase YbeY